MLRVFFICGAFTGIIGTAMGVILGCLFAIYIDPIFSFVNYVMGGGVWDPSIRGIYALARGTAPELMCLRPWPCRWACLFSSPISRPVAQRG